MSLDFILVDCNEVYSGNMTHNVTDMWREAGVYNALYNSHGLKAWLIIDQLAAGIGDMVTFPEKYKNMDSENGWGTYDRALPFLIEVYKNCKKNPGARIEIDK